MLPRPWAAVLFLGSWYVRDAPALASIDGYSADPATFACARACSTRCSDASRSRFCAKATSTTRFKSSLPSSCQNGRVLWSDLKPIPETSLQPPGSAICGRWNSGARLQADNAIEKKIKGLRKYLVITPSLRSQSHDRIQPRRLARRQVTKNQSRGGCAHEGQHGRRQRKDYRHAAVAQGHPGDEPDENAKDAAGSADHS